MITTNKDSIFYNSDLEKVVEAANKKETAMSEYADGIDKKHWLRYEGFVKQAIHDHDALKHHSMLLMHLLDNRAYKGKVDKHDTWNHWYVEKGLIVASMSQQKMADDLGVYRSRIERWIKTLEDAKLIKVVKEKRENVYVLGFIKDLVEVFYYEI